MHDQKKCQPKKCPKCRSAMQLTREAEDDVIVRRFWWCLNDECNHEEAIEDFDAICPRCGVKLSVNCANCGHPMSKHKLYQESGTGAPGSKCTVNGCKCPDFEEGNAREEIR